MRYTRKLYGGGNGQSLPTDFIMKEIVENQLFRQTINFRVSEIERKLKTITKHLIDSLPSNSNNYVKLTAIGGARKTRRSRKSIGKK